MNAMFNSRAVSAFRPLQQKERITVMEGLLISPNAFLNHFRRYVVLGLVVRPLMHWGPIDLPLL